MMEKRFLLGIDIGTSGVKAALFDLDGNLMTLRQQEYQFSHPHPGWSEIDPNLVWFKLTEVVRNCVAASGLDARSIVALGLSVLGEDAFPIDEAGQPIYPAIESIDKRNNAYQAYVAWFAEKFGAEKIFEKTSYPLNSLPPAHKILWLRDFRPDVFSRIHKYISFQDFALLKMTGTLAIDYSMASRTMFFDAQRKTWVEEFLLAMGISPDHLSIPCLATQPVGLLLEDTAGQLGLAAGTLVVAGAHDQSCAALGIGAVREGIAGNGLGSVEAIATVTLKPFTSPAMLARGIGSQCHVTPDTYLVLGFHLSAGSLVRWYRDQLGMWEKEHALATQKDPYDLITEEAQTSPPGSNGLLVLPHWSGAGTGRNPALNPASRGAILGLTLAHTKADLSRSIFEGITYESRFIIEVLEGFGIKIDSLVVTGGGAKSPFWLQLKADITGKPIVVPKVTEASLLGAAILAGVGAKVYQDVHEATNRVCSKSHVYTPSLRDKPVYDRAYAIYQDLYESALSICSRLALT